MDNEQLKTVEGLKLAIQIEIDGKKYYEQAAITTANTIGKQLFEWLGGEEDKHRNRFEQIYNSIKKKKSWPKIAVEPGAGPHKFNIFVEALKDVSQKPQQNDIEMNIIDRAMDIEEQTQKLYTERSKAATHEEERNFYNSIAVEEKGHYLALVDYREYIIDPAHYFAIHERHSLDGA